MQNKRLLSISLASAIVGILIMTTDNLDKQKVYTEKDDDVISYLDNMTRQENRDSEQAYLVSQEFTNLNFLDNNYFHLAFLEEIKTIFTPSEIEKLKSDDYLYTADASLQYTNYLYGTRYFYNSTDLKGQ